MENRIYLESTKRNQKIALKYCYNNLNNKTKSGLYEQYIDDQIKYSEEVRKNGQIRLQH